MNVCLDTMIFIWGIADRAADLFRRFRDKHGWKIKKGEQPKVKVDAMIAAIADLASADYILTDNESDFEHYREEIRPEILSLRNLTADR